MYLCAIECARNVQKKPQKKKEIIVDTQGRWQKKKKTSDRKKKNVDAGHADGLRSAGFEKEKRKQEAEGRLST